MSRWGPGTRLRCADVLDAAMHACASGTELRVFSTSTTHSVAVDWASATAVRARVARLGAVVRDACQERASAAASDGTVLFYAYAPPADCLVLMANEIVTLDEGPNGPLPEWVARRASPEALGVGLTAAVLRAYDLTPFGASTEPSGPVASVLGTLLQDACVQIGARPAGAVGLHIGALEKVADWFAVNLDTLEVARVLAEAPARDVHVPRPVLDAPGPHWG